MRETINWFKSESHKKSFSKCQDLSKVLSQRLCLAIEKTECLQYFLDIRGLHPLPMHVFVWDGGGAMAQRRGKVGRRGGVWGSVCVGVCVSE